MGTSTKVSSAAASKEKRVRRDAAEVPTDVTGDRHDDGQRHCHITYFHLKRKAAKIKGGRTRFWADFLTIVAPGHRKTFITRTTADADTSSQPDGGAVKHEGVKGGSFEEKRGESSNGSH